MDTPRPDLLDRTMKLELDEGRARTVDDARQMVAGYVLQIEVGDGILDSETRQAMLLTAVNAARRAFIGGVRVRLHTTGTLCVSWTHKLDLAASIQAFGGHIVDSLDRMHPTLVLGKVQQQPPGSIVLYATWEGWSGGVVQQQRERLAESSEFPLVGVLAGALAVSEAFQHVRGSTVAGRRSTGLSLWKPQCSWQADPAYGEPCPYLPKRLWLVGLGHLGQAYAWTLGLLPYADQAAVDLMLQDSDLIVKANKSTGMLIDDSSVSQKKTRAVATRLEALGFRTAITERDFDSAKRRADDEPSVALIGVDDPAPRRLLEEADFDLVVDAGLGGNSQDYLDILIHSFPSGIAAATAWPRRPDTVRSDPTGQPAYRDLEKRLSRTTDQTDGEIKCGVLEIAGRSVGAAFVGCVAATLVLSEVLRALVGGPRFEVLGLSLRSPHKPQVAANSCQGRPVNPGFVRARTLSEGKESAMPIAGRCPSRDT